MVPLHTAIDSQIPRADRAEIHFPAYRGMALIPLLSWLVVERLTVPDAVVTWNVDRQRGPDSVQRRLQEQGWTLTRSRSGRAVHLRGRRPQAAVRPTPASIDVRLGSRRMVLLADYGVFSPGGVDAGTEQLLRHALAGPSVGTVADVGIGYGPLAIGLVANHVAEDAVASDVDSLSLWLALENARRNEIPLHVELTDDPTRLPATPLTVCNIPTHIDRVQTAHLMDALARRARTGRLLVVVHLSLESRYARQLETAGLSVSTFPSSSHVVLEARAGRAARTSGMRR